MDKSSEKGLTASLEDYLEAVLFLVREGSVARVRDIASRLDVGMPSVTAAMKALSKRDLVNYDPYQVVTLTERGMELAEEIGNRHATLRRFLTEVLGIEEDLAEANACRMEHAIDDEVLARLVELGEFLRCCPRVRGRWLEEFTHYCMHGRDPRRCKKCLEEAVQDFQANGTGKDGSVGEAESPAIGRDRSR